MADSIEMGFYSVSDRFGVRWKAEQYPRTPAGEPAEPDVPETR